MQRRRPMRVALHRARVSTIERESACKSNDRSREGVAYSGSVRNSPWFQASTVWTETIEIACTLEQSGTFGMPLALDGKPLVNVLTLLEESEESCPEWSPFPGMQKRSGVANQDEAISST